MMWSTMLSTMSARTMVNEYWISIMSALAFHSLAYSTKVKADNFRVFFVLLVSLSNQYSKCSPSGTK